MLLRLAASDKTQLARENLTRAIRAKLTEGDVVQVRVPELSTSDGVLRANYPLHMAIFGPQQKSVAQWTEKPIPRLHKNKDLLDVWFDRESLPQSGIRLEIDRQKLANQGVSLTDLNVALQVQLGSLELPQFGRTWQVVVRTDAKPGKELDKELDDLKQMKIRNVKGDMVPVTALVTILEIKEPRVIYRLNLEPMVALTASPASGLSLAKARMVIGLLAEEAREEAGLSREYRLTWLP